ncbi:MAG: DMT family transporter [Pseudomonadota bacterium]
MRISLLAPSAIVIAMLILAIGDNFVPVIAEHMSVWHYHAIRAGLILPGLVIAMVLFGLARKTWPKRPIAVIQRSFFSTSALVLYFSAIPAVSISLAAAGLFTSPIFVVVISVIVFRERIGWRRIVGVLVGFTGVLLVLKIGTQPVQIMAFAPMIGGMMYALSIIWTRRYCRQEHPSTMAFWNLLFFFVAGVIGITVLPGLRAALAAFDGTDFLIRSAGWPETWVLGLLFLMGLSAATGMLLLAYGYSQIDSSFAALFDFSFLLWAPLFAWLLRAEPLDLRSALGMFMILLAGILALTGLQRDQHKFPQDAKS